MEPTVALTVLVGLLVWLVVHQRVAAAATSAPAYDALGRQDRRVLRRALRAARVPRDPDLADIAVDYAAAHPFRWLPWRLRYALWPPLGAVAVAALLVGLSMAGGAEIERDEPPLATLATMLYLLPLWAIPLYAYAHWQSLRLARVEAAGRKRTAEH